MHLQQVSHYMALTDDEPEGYMAGRKKSPGTAEARQEISVWIIAHLHFLSMVALRTWP